MDNSLNTFRDTIRQRAMLLRELRRWFDDRDFLEVQPPCLSGECIIDAYIDPISVSSDQFELSAELPERYFLQTSPEAVMKRMLAAGAPSIYSLGPTFRRGERGAQHNVEFTMLEWYQLDADLHDGIQLLGSLATEILQRESFEVACYRDLFQKHVMCDPIDFNVALLEDYVAEIDKNLAESLSGDRDGLLDVLWTSRVQPHLGWDRPLIVKNYPLSQAALARVAPDDPQCSARFELFVDAVELANGYDELGDADELIHRFNASNQQRVENGRKPLPLPQRFLQAMKRGLPSCAGVALGVDRLLMVRTGVTKIEKVLPFPIELA